MAALGETPAGWQRPCTHGAVWGLVIAAHLALLLALLVPVKPRPRAKHTLRRDSRVLQVELLAIPAAPSKRPLAAIHHPRPTPLASHRRAASRQTAKPRSAPLQVSMAPASATTVQPAFIAGGNFDTRLRSARPTPSAPRLPGGHHYLVSDLRFIPLQQQSIAGKLHRVAALIGLGWFDPVCRNAEHELTKSRLQQIADGYTPADLERMEREHCGP